MGAALLAVGIGIVDRHWNRTDCDGDRAVLWKHYVFDSIALAILAGFLSHGLLGVHPALAIVIGIAVLLGLLLLHRTRPGFWLIGGGMSIVWGFIFATMAYEFSARIWCGPMWCGCWELYWSLPFTCGHGTKLHKVRIWPADEPAGCFFLRLNVRSQCTGYLK